jgi:LPS-assembly lipoprotein
MWSCDPRAALDRHPFARVVRRVAVALTLVSLAGCAGGDGFRPMYAPDATGASVQSRMAKVDVAPIPSRVGQRVRNELIFQKTGGGEAESPEYRLDITIREALASTLVKNTGEALSQIYTLDANFKLIRLSDKKVVLQGASHGRAGFERFQQIYSNVRAREDAENRAARTVADDIKTRLAAVLSSSQI